MDIQLGFEIPTGRPVVIPVKHMVVCGQSQVAGKTTTLEALVTRSNLRALAFVTKRGEGSFSIGRQIQPFFRDGADWQFVESLLEAALQEKNKFQRAWVQKACQGARTLADVHKRTKKLMKDSTRSMDQDQYMLLNSYFDIVIPQIERLPKSPRLIIGPGLNVMDLTAYTPEMQMLVVRSAIDWVHQHEQNTITIIPEAWKFVPEGKGSPVKGAAERLVREGAALHNFIWLDSQDIGGVSKVLIRQCTVWIIGVQREANEIKRTLANIPAGIKQPKAHDIQTLKIGQFFACSGDDINKTYVRPAWMAEEDAKAIAKGTKKFSDVKQIESAPTSGPFVTPAGISGDLTPRRYDQTSTETNDMSTTDEKLNQLIALMSQSAGARHPYVPVTQPGEVNPSPKSLDPGEDAMFQRFKQRLVDEAPAIIMTIADRPEIHVKEERVVIEADKTVKGRLALLISLGFFDKGAASGDSAREFDKRGWSYANISMGMALKDLTTAGALTKTDKTYTKVSGIKIVNIKE